MSVGEPAKRHGTCGFCQGRITYYPRRSDDVAPRSCAVDEAARWAHDRVEDWLSRPHRACPAVGGVSDSVGAVVEQVGSAVVAGAGGGRS